MAKRKQVSREGLNFVGGNNESIVPDGKGCKTMPD